MKKSESNTLLFSCLEPFLLPHLPSRVATHKVEIAISLKFLEETNLGDIGFENLLISNPIRTYIYENDGSFTESNTYYPLFRGEKLVLIMHPHVNGEPIAITEEESAALLQDVAALEINENTPRSRSFGMGRHTQLFLKLFFGTTVFCLSRQMKKAMSPFYNRPFTISSTAFGVGHPVMLLI